MVHSSDVAAAETIRAAKADIDALSSKYGRVAAELQIMHEDLKYYKLLVRG